MPQNCEITGGEGRVSWSKRAPQCIMKSPCTLYAITRSQGEEEEEEEEGIVVDEGSTAEHSSHPQLDHQFRDGSHSEDARMGEEDGLGSSRTPCSSGPSHGRVGASVYAGREAGCRRLKVTCAGHVKDPWCLALAFTKWQGGLGGSFCAKNNLGTGSVPDILCSSLLKQPKSAYCSLQDVSVEDDEACESGEHSNTRLGERGHTSQNMHNVLRDVCEYPSGPGL
eukprot:scaffold160077_cov19-Tisochrysis_lutea.AAC.2